MTCLILSQRRKRSARQRKRIRERGKATIASLMGRKAAAEKAESLVASAIAALAPYGGKADTLREAARFIVSRKK